MPLHPRTKKKLIEANLYKEVRKYCNVIEPQKYRNLLSNFDIKKIYITVSKKSTKHTHTYIYIYI